MAAELFTPEVDEGLRALWKYELDELTALRRPAAACSSAACAPLVAPGIAAALPAAPAALLLGSLGFVVRRRIALASPTTVPAPSGLAAALRVAWQSLRTAAPCSWLSGLRAVFRRLR